MRHYKTAKIFLIGTIVLALGMVITTVILIQQGAGTSAAIISHSGWTLFIIAAIVGVTMPMEKKGRVQIIGGLTILLFFGVLATVSQQMVDADDGLANANRVLTAVSTLSMGILTWLWIRYRYAQQQVNTKMVQGVYLRIKPQPDHVKTNDFWTRFPTNYFVREGVRPDNHLTFELTGTSLQQEIGMYLPPEPPVREMLLKELQASWPGIQVEVVKQEAFNETYPIKWVDLELKLNDKFPLFYEAEGNRGREYRVDRLEGLLKAIQLEDSRAQVGIQMLVRVAPEHVAQGWRDRVNRIEIQLSQRGSKTVGNLEGTSRQTTTFGPQNIVQLQQEQNALKARIALDNAYYETIIRIWVSHPKISEVDQLQKKVASMVIAQLAGMNKLQLSRRKGTDWQTVAQRPYSDRGGIIMTGRELEATFHMPTAETAAQNPLLETNRAMSLPPQPGVIVSNPNHVAGYITGKGRAAPVARVYGRYQQGAERIYIGHSFKQTHAHLFATGATGAGKSVLAQNIIFQDWLGGNSVLVVDPHGALIEDVLAQTPLEMEEKVIILDPESQNPFKYNICQIGKEFGTDRTVEVLMEAMQVAMGVSWESSVGMQQILRNAFILALASDLECDMVHVYGMLDPVKRTAALKRVKKTAVGSVRLAVEFWEEKFPSWDKPAKSRAVGAAERRLGVFVQSAVIRRTLGSRGASVNLEKAINEGCLILAPMGNLSEETKRLWAAILVREVTHILRKRGSGRYCTTTLVFDEMKSTIGTLGGYVQQIVEELRKYKASGAFFAQSFSQLPQDVVLALKANCRTQIVMSTGADDAKIASEVLGSVQASDIQNLPAYHAYAKIYAGGTQEKPCLIKMLPIKQREGNPMRRDMELRPPRGVYHPGTAQIAELSQSATDYEIAAYLSQQGGHPEKYQQVILFLKKSIPSRVERLLRIQKDTLTWMSRCMQENPGLLSKKSRIRLRVNAAIGTPWWWSDYLFETLRNGSNKPIRQHRDREVA